jgi:hypothetical protein
MIANEPEAAKAMIKMAAATLARKAAKAAQ